MTKRITREQALEHGPHQFVAYASDLGLAPGEWPELFETNIGNGLHFIWQHQSFDENGGVSHVSYRQELGCCDLYIYND